MYRYIPFEEIEKDKWNGCVHYATNGNPYGYYWYLKAVVKEWGAVIENDYESVTPILKEAIYKEAYKLLPFLGPYSISILNHTRVNSFIATIEEESKANVYPLNARVPLKTLNGKVFTEENYSSLDTMKTYEELIENYNQSYRTLINDGSKENLKIVSGLKPEALVELKSNTSVYYHSLLRIMYNAMHRGIGFSSGILDKSTGNYTAASFFIASHNSIYELYSYHTVENHRAILLDLLIRNQASKGRSIICPDEHSVPQELGFNPSVSYKLKVANKVSSRIKKALKLRY